VDENPAKTKFASLLRRKRNLFCHFQINERATLENEEADFTNEVGVLSPGISICEDAEAVNDRWNSFAV
jgi:hypothetical protein